MTTALAAFGLAVLVFIVALFVAIAVGRILALNNMDDESDSRVELMKRLIPPRDEQEK